MTSPIEVFDLHIGAAVRVHSGLGRQIELVLAAMFDHYQPKI